MIIFNEVIDCFEVFTRKMVAIVVPRDPVSVGQVDLSAPENHGMCPTGTFQASGSHWFQYNDVTQLMASQKKTKQINCLFNSLLRLPTQWIPLTKGQSCRKRLRALMSSCANEGKKAIHQLSRIATGFNI